MTAHRPLYSEITGTDAQAGDYVACRALCSCGWQGPTQVLSEHDHAWIAGLPGGARGAAREVYADAVQSFKAHAGQP